MAGEFPQVSSQTVRFGPGQDALFVAFNGKGHGSAGRNGIHAGPVQDFIHVENAVHVVVETKTAQRKRGFVFGLVRLSRAVPGRVQMPPHPSGQE